MIRVQQGQAGGLLAIIFFSVYGLGEADKYIRGACVHVCMCTLVQIYTHLFTVQEIAFQVPSQTWG